MFTQLHPALPVLAVAPLSISEIVDIAVSSSNTAEWSRSVLTHQQIQIWLSSGRGMGDFRIVNTAGQPFVGYLETANEHSGQALLPGLQCIV